MARKPEEALRADAPSAIRRGGPGGGPAPGDQWGDRSGSPPARRAGPAGLAPRVVCRVTNSRKRCSAPGAAGLGDPTDYPDLISDHTVVFAASKLVPQVAEQVGDAVVLEVTVGGRPVTNGTLVPAEDLMTEPRLSGSRPSDIYCLVMVDPDFPSPSVPKYKDTLLWMLTNIKGDALDDADCPVEYMCNEPGSGTHRYALLCYRQPGFQQIEPPAKRTKEWANSHGWGDPVGGLFFKAQHGK
ncbi:hypothetical protein Rsub_03578 [Raphidocelis subcapitata]|uniref:Phosphatidylethanolamine-binding protein n=1 Tax=Raphidocelis subcapitata TaxID=307507 RepID=A0A2V0NUB8_9CHLO|nr:hypothetical protein Rsub_03578 [Raphidocelis subcapitata]|eukprot:GBF91258.1 hypothetical protein Rsub_03578 [Raphidocelis subcapitata]